MTILCRKCSLHVFVYLQRHVNRSSVCKLGCLSVISQFSCIDLVTHFVYVNKYVTYHIETYQLSAATCFSFHNSWFLYVNYHFFRAHKLWPTQKRHTNLFKLISGMGCFLQICYLYKQREFHILHQKNYEKRSM